MRRVAKGAVVSVGAVCLSSGVNDEALRMSEGGHGERGPGGDEPPASRAPHGVGVAASARPAIACPPDPTRRLQPRRHRPGSSEVFWVGPQLSGRPGGSCWHALGAYAPIGAASTFACSRKAADAGSCPAEGHSWTLACAALAALGPAKIVP